MSFFAQNFKVDSITLSFWLKISLSFFSGRPWVFWKHSINKPVILNILYNKVALPGKIGWNNEVKEGIASEANFRDFRWTGEGLTVLQDSTMSTIVLKSTSSTVCLPLSSSSISSAFSFISALITCQCLIIWKQRNRIFYILKLTVSRRVAVCTLSVWGCLIRLPGKLGGPGWIHGARLRFFVLKVLELSNCQFCRP